MIWNSVLIIGLCFVVACGIYFVRKRMDLRELVLRKRKDVLSLVLNCNNYRPMGDVFSSLAELLQQNQESDHIEYRGHF